ncbi:428_t:CDS:2, partial [Paraglomus occultum]
SSVNILIFYGTAKIIDFGLSASTEQIMSRSRSIGAAAYIDPLLFKDPSYVCGKKSDIFSLGVLLWEISSGRAPCAECKHRFQAYQYRKDGYRDPPVAGTPEPYITLYSECWSENPDERPLCEEICKRLEKLLLDNQNLSALEEIPYEPQEHRSTNPYKKWIEEAIKRGLVNRYSKKDVTINPRPHDVGGYGLVYKATMKKQMMTKSRGKGNVAYIDPMSFSGHYKRGKKSDIFSLGVLLWEISSGRIPCYGHWHTSKVILFRLEGGRDPPFPETPEAYVTLYSECWGENPDKRPLCENVYERLVCLLENS